MGAFSASSYLVITRLLIAFEDFLGSSIAPQVMPPCDRLTDILHNRNGKLCFNLFKLATKSTHLGENSSAGVVLEDLEYLELVDVWTWRTGVRVTGTGVLASPPPTSPPLPSPRTRSSPMHSLHVTHSLDVTLGVFSTSCHFHN